MSERSIKSYFIATSANENKRLKTDFGNENDKEKKTDENVIVSHKKVHPNTFLKWQKQCPWLQMLENEDLMICVICKEFAKPGDSTFVNGCPAFRFETVKKHDSSLVHNNACKAKFAKNNPSEAPLARAAVRAMDLEKMANMEKLFNTAYLIAKEDYALDDFKSLCQLQVKNGLNIGGTYMNNKAAREFIKYIAESLRKDLKDQLTKTEFFSLMADGSTDRSVMASEIIYLCYLQEGEPKCNYIALTECKDETANGIKLGIASVLQEFVPDWKSKLIAVCFDGASVNMGRSSGVSKLLESDCGRLVSIHCVAHRLELAIADAIKHVKDINTVEDIRGIHSFYHSSPKRTKELKCIGDILEEKVLSPVALHGIRWLESRHRAVKVLDNNLAAIVTHMEQAVSSEPESKVSAKLKGYLKHLKSERFIKFLFLMEDVTNVLARMSQVFQQRYISINEILCALQSTKQKLNRMITENGNALKRFKEEKVNTESNITYRGINLTISDTNHKYFNEEREKFLQGIIDSLNERYNNLLNDKLLGNLHIFDPCNVVNLNEDQNEKITMQFREVIETLPHNMLIDKEAAMEEFEDYKVRAKNKLNITYQCASQRLLAESASSATFCNLRKILHLIMILPLSTAECERGFSHLNLIKRDTRVRLLPNTVDDLLFIRLYGPNMTEFNPHCAIELWWNDVECGRKRRPDFKQ